MIISKEEVYKWARNTYLKPCFRGIVYNYRDLAIYILTCNGLSIEEIRKLKVEDVEFVCAKSPQAVLHLRSIKIIITELVMVLDLMKCIAETDYIRIYKNNPRKIHFLDSPYLIKQKRRLGQAIEENLLKSRLEKISRVMERMEESAERKIIYDLIQKLIGLKFHIDTYKEDIRKALSMDLEVWSDEVYYQLVLFYEDFTFQLETKTNDGLHYIVLKCKLWRGWTPFDDYRINPLDHL